MPSFVLGKRGCVIAVVATGVNELVDVCMCECVYEWPKLWWIMREGPWCVETDVAWVKQR